MAHYSIRALQEKWSILFAVKRSKNRRQTLKLCGIAKSTYYDWLRKGPKPMSRAPKKIWNRTKKLVVRMIAALRESADPLKHSPMRILEFLEYRAWIFMSEPGIKGVLKRLNAPPLKRHRSKTFYVRPRAEKFFQVLCVDEFEWLRFRPRDTFALNWVDEASYYAVRSTVLGHKPNQYDVLRDLKAILVQYGRLPKVIRFDNAQIFRARTVRAFLRRHGVQLDYITKGCPEENWPVESWHSPLREHVINRHGYGTIHEWQAEFDRFRGYYNDFRRLRSDPLLRTPREVAYAFTTPQTQQRLKLRLLRKHRRCQHTLKNPHPVLLSALQVSEMCVT